jgi:hypothetical protein
MTTLNTKEYLKADDARGCIQYTNSYDNRLAYLSLATILEICINKKMGINQIQEMLDEMTKGEQAILESLMK